MRTEQKPMIQALRHGWTEGIRAAALADDWRSRAQLRWDFWFSRLLKLGRLPGYNRLRQVNLKGHSIHYRFNRGDLQSLREVMLEDVYACDQPMSPCTVLDLGANIGLASTWLAKRIRLNSIQCSSFFLLAVEPVPTNAEVARMNFSSNQIPGAIIQAAVGQQSGEAWFEARAESNLGFLVQEELKGRISVPVIGIRELLDRLPHGRADLVKMDIEGGEEQLLGHATDWLERVRALIVEWHDDRADSRPLIRNVEAAGFSHQRINVRRQDNLSIFVKLPQILK